MHYRHFLLKFCKKVINQLSRIAEFLKKLHAVLICQNLCAFKGDFSSKDNLMFRAKKTCRILPRKSPQCARTKVWR